MFSRDELQGIFELINRASITGKESHFTASILNKIVSQLTVNKLDNNGITKNSNEDPRKSE